jgi:hypothetical protein
VTIVLVGILLLFDITLVAFVTPIADLGRAAAAALARSQCRRSDAFAGEASGGQRWPSRSCAEGRVRRRSAADEPPPEPRSRCPARRP